MAGGPSSGPRTVSVARRCPASIATVTWLYSSLSADTLPPSGASATPFVPSFLEGVCAAREAARSATTASNLLRGNVASTSFHSSALLALQPSAVVEKTSARSRRMRRLSTRRVKPPVPGSTPRSGTSGSETAELPSSTRMISLQASASSYPPPDAVPLHAAIQCWSEPAWASSMEQRVSLVYLQKLTLKGCVEDDSIMMLAPAQNTLFSADDTTTVFTPGCSKRRRCTTSASSMSTPRS